MYRAHRGTEWLHLSLIVCLCVHYDWFIIIMFPFRFQLNQQKYFHYYVLFRFEQQYSTRAYMQFAFLFSWHFIEYQPHIISVLISSIFISQNIFMVFSFDFNHKIRAKPLHCRSLMLTLVSSNSFVYSVAATNWNCKPQRITLSATVAVNESEFSMIKKRVHFSTA